MLVYLALVFGIALMIVLWSIGVVAFDAFMLLIFIVLVAACVKTLLPFLPGNRGDNEPGSGRSWTPR